MVALTVDEKQNIIDDMLLKKFKQTAFTSSLLAAGGEAEGSSALQIPSKNVWAQKVPATTPFNPALLVWNAGNQVDSSGERINIYDGSSNTYIYTNTSSPITKTLLGGQGRTITGKFNAIGLYGSKYVHSSCPYVAYYEYVSLSSTTAFVAYRYANTRTEGSTNNIPNTVGSTNILQPGIPSNYDPVLNGYKVYVYANTATSSPTLLPSVLKDAGASDYPWTYDPTSGYLTFTSSNGVNGETLNTAGWEPCITFWRYEGSTLETKLSSLETAIAAAGSGSGSGISVESDPLFYKYIVNPPLDVSFQPQTCARTASQIFIPWDKPVQISLGAIQINAPLITEINAEWTAKISATISPVTKPILSKNTTMIPYLTSSPKVPNTNCVTGIVLTNVAQTPAISDPSNVHFPNDVPGTLRRALIVYDPSFALLDPAGSTSTNFVSVWYTNYNTDISANIQKKGFDIFITPGYPTQPGPPTTSGLSTYTTAAPTTKFTQGTLPTYTDNTLGVENNAFPLARWYFKWTSDATNSIRYNGGLPSVTSDISTNVIPTPTTYTLYPDTSYSLILQVGNSSSNNNTTNSGTSGLVGLSVPSASYTFISPYLTPKTTWPLTQLSLSFTDTPNSTSNVSIVSTKAVASGNVFFGAPTANMVGSISNFGINNIYTRGVKDTTNDLLNIACSITGRGSDTTSVSYKGFGSTQPTSTTSTNGSVVFTPGTAVDSYISATSTSGFYLETGTGGTITLKYNEGTTKLFDTSGNANSLTTLSLVVTQYGNASGVGSSYINNTYTYNPYSFYYDLSPCINAAPVWTDVAFTAVLRNINPTISPTIQICGVNVCTGSVGVSTTTTFINNALGKYFYYNGSSGIITYSNNSISVKETTIDNASATTTNGYFANPTIFSNIGTNTSGKIIYNPSTTAWSNSFYVAITNYINCLGTGSPTGTPPASISFNGIWDPLSITNVATSASIPFTPLVGCRVETGVSDVTYPSATTIGSSGVSLINTAYPNTELLSVSGNRDLQLCNGIYATQKASVTTGYLNYTLTSYQNPSIYTQNTGIDYSSIENRTTGYRYATFAWILPPGTTAAPLQYSKVAFTIDGIIIDGVSGTINNVDTIPTIGSSNGLFTMQYRIQNGDPTKKAPSQGNQTSVWINAFSGSGLTPTSAAVISDPAYNGQINGDNTALLNDNSTAGTLKVYSLISSAPSTTTSSGPGSFYLYCRIGLPMECSVGFKSIKASFS